MIEKEAKIKSRGEDLSKSESENAALLEEVAKLKQDRDYSLSDIDKIESNLVAERDAHKQTQLRLEQAQEQVKLQNSGTQKSQQNAITTLKISQLEQELVTTKGELDQTKRTLQDMRFLISTFKNLEKQMPISFTNGKDIEKQVKQ